MFPPLLASLLPAVFSSHAVVGASAVVGSLLLMLSLLLLASDHAIFPNNRYLLMQSLESKVILFLS
jgi:hypothetical protein